MTNLPQGWEVKRLEEVCEVVMGQSPNGNCIFDKDKNKDLIEFHQGKIAFSDKYIDESNFVTSDVRKIAKKNSVVLCVRAPVGEVNITTKDIAIGRGLCSLNGVKINNNFLFFYLLTLKKYFNDNSTGSTFKAINVRVIKETKIPLPPLKEQERIVGILDFAFSKIDENIKKAKENLANIDELMQNTLQKAFNPLNDNTKENYQLPQSWEWKSLGIYALLQMGHIKHLTI
ncbi:restriction endonuclease subunit S [Campylobacter jejuni]|uniref:restriction endonuclease subunit S n=1 Tax=Campylobacter jejuni TaxID=197 RepID=UPI002741E0D0|nr:restriction endonuclease subunit S [Campylobacter jejuni]MDQ6376719.1 restriction endonuclease subunit S [Campylobacter jejuni]MDQ6379590.1 restriction endonuclease subunit S [Campylobacter jejuni]MDQ6381794.1 restriction endonuclease subunit S [Campylobacter jejuni]